MNRRDFLRSAGIISAGFAITKKRRLFAKDSVPTGWRTFEVTTRVEVLKPSGTTRVWLPAALTRNTPFQRTMGNQFHAEGATPALIRGRAEDGLGIVRTVFPAGVKPILTLISRVATKNYKVDFSEPGDAPKASPEELEYFLRPTKLAPVGGIVKLTADKITLGARTDVEKARAIYEWIVVNTFRNPKARGCGLGDIRFMLETHDLGGKCADLNGLYVGLARASGLPARNVYGIRTAKSQLGYKSLGVSSDNVTKAQHCRAEVYLNDYGWVPVDPADVRKVMLEEPPGNLSLQNPMVRKARARLFGFWEMNWMAYNFADDVALPGSDGPTIPFLLYPQAETAAGRLDSLDPESFRYEIRAKEIFA